MDSSIFSGACTAMITPFKDGKIYYPMVEQLLRRQIDSGIRTVVLAGTTGESPTLSDLEKITLLERSKQFTGDTCRLILGTGSNSTEHAVILSEKAQQAGADGLLLVSPYYNKANPDGLYMHYWTIAQHISVPGILYNVPSRTGVDIPISVYEQLSKLPVYIGVKEAGTDLGKITETLTVCPKHFKIWSGNDNLIVPVMSVGGCGVISVLSNICPQETNELCCAALSGDFKRAATLQKRLLPLIKLLFCEVNPLPVKYAMGVLGYDCGPCRLPLTHLTEEHKKKIYDYLTQ